MYDKAWLEGHFNVSALIGEPPKTRLVLTYFSTEKYVFM